MCSKLGTTLNIYFQSGKSQREEAMFFFLSQGTVILQSGENYILKFESVYIYFSGTFIQENKFPPFL